ncbi:hypothetical protein [Marinactinospora rubrisoli]|uniref:Uncharacterized protein n=1 Tax=Marinactinospora rubrisoli TaxID=2715399 RepID=A0ABW2KCD9_9ACTN
MADGDRKEHATYTVDDHLLEMARNAFDAASREWEATFEVASSLAVTFLDSSRDITRFGNATVARIRAEVGRLNEFRSHSAMHVLDAARNQENARLREQAGRPGIGRQAAPEPTRQAQLIAGYRAYQEATRILGSRTRSVRGIALTAARYLQRNTGTWSPPDAHRTAIQSGTSGVPPLRVSEALAALRLHESQTAAGAEHELGERIDRLVALRSQAAGAPAGSRAVDTPVSVSVTVATAPGAGARRGAASRTLSAAQRRQRTSPHAGGGASPS